MRSYDANNIFAKIVRGELPSHKVYEDEETLAFMDIMPRCEGHTLVVPKTAARNLLDANASQLAACIKTVQKVSQAIMKAFNADGITLQQFNEGAGGQVVFHLHFHVLPRREGVTLGPHTSNMEKPDVLAQNAEKIKRALGAHWAAGRGIGRRRPTRSSAAALRPSTFRVAFSSPTPPAACPPCWPSAASPANAGIAGSGRAAWRSRGRRQDPSTTPSSVWPRPRTSRR